MAHLGPAFRQWRNGSDSAMVLTTQGIVMSFTLPPADPGTVPETYAHQPGQPPNQPGQPPRWAIVGGAVVVGLIIVSLIPGITGDVLAFLAWAGAAGACVRSARSRTPSTLRLWARIGVVVAACMAVVMGSLAIADAAGSGGATATAGPICYYQVQDTLGGSPFTVAILGVSDCSNYAVGNSEFAVTGVNTAKGAGNAICTGTDNGQTGTVITTEANYQAGNAYCDSAGWADLPQG